MLASTSKVMSFVAIAFYFLILDRQTETSRLHKLWLLQHLKRSRRKRMVLLQIALKNTRRAIDVISLKIGGKKISGYQGVLLSTLYEWLDRIWRRETRDCANLSL